MRMVTEYCESKHVMVGAVLKVMWFLFGFC